MVAIPFLADSSFVADKTTVQIWASLISLLVLTGLIFLVRGQKLKISYSLLWFAGWGICTGVIVYPQIMDNISQKLGIYYSPTLLILLILLSLGVITLHITIVLTRLTRHINILAQEIALLKEKDPRP